MKLRPNEEESAKETKNFIHIPNTLLPHDLNIFSERDSASELKFTEEIESNISINLFQNVKAQHMRYHIAFDESQCVSNCLFNREMLQSLFIRISRKNRVTISNEAFQLIVQRITSMIMKLILISSQSSRKRANCYVDNANKRVVHLNPIVSLNFSLLEEFTKNKIYERFHVQQSEYEPLFIKETKAKLISFKPDSEEAHVQNEQMVKMFSTIEFNTKNKINPAHKDEFTNAIQHLTQYVHKAEEVRNSQTGQRSASNDSTQNIRVNRFFCSAKREESNQMRRVITGKDVLYSLHFLPKPVQQFAAELRLSDWKK